MLLKQHTICHTRSGILDIWRRLLPIDDTIVVFTFRATLSWQNKKLLHYKSITVLSLYLRPLLYRVAAKTHFLRGCIQANTLENSCLNRLTKVSRDWSGKLKKYYSDYIFIKSSILALSLKKFSYCWQRT